MSEKSYLEVRKDGKSFHLFWTPTEERLCTMGRKDVRDLIKQLQKVLDE